MRPQIANEMDDEFVTCDLSIFMATYMPFDPNDDDIQKCISTVLGPKGLVDYARGTNSVRFTEYQSAPDGTTNEIKTYAGLESIGKAIGDYQYSGRSRNNLHYRHVPSSEIKSNIRGSTHRIDACYTSDKAPERPEKVIELTTTGIAVPMEHKLSVADKSDNNSKIVSANVQIMNDDIRRMFTFGITIECGDVTLWYHSRSHSLVSKPFSFIDEPIKLIKIFMSFQFAKLEQLGYDPSVTLEKDYQYTYTIGDDNRKFRTISPISEYRSNNISGRMARIFLVTEVDSVPPKNYVLKDVWIDGNAQTEGQIQTELFADIRKFWTEDPTSIDNKELEELKHMHADLVRSEQFKKFFLSIEIDCVGMTSKRVPKGSVRQRGMFKKTVPASQYQMSQAEELRESTGPPGPMPQMTHHEKQAQLSRRFSPKKQYRVVFQEVCTPLGELETLGEVMDVLHQVLTPLELMFCAGWVHRDISSGNILAYKDNTDWQAKLSDLEYAKKFPPATEQAALDPKTGTPYFMPFEILAKEYIYKPLPRVGAKARNRYRVAADQENQKGIVQGIVHNFQHDLESIWWLVLWTLTCRIDHREAYKWALPIFQNTTELSHERRVCFTTSIQHKLGNILISPAKLLAKPMDIVKNVMLTAYEDRERSGDLFTRGTYVNIYLEFREFFEDGLVYKIPPTWRDIVLIKDDPSRRPYTPSLELIQDLDPTDVLPTTSQAEVPDNTQKPAAPPQDSTSQTPIAVASRVDPPVRSKRELSPDPLGSAGPNAKRSRGGIPE